MLGFSCFSLVLFLLIGTLPALVWLERLQLARSRPLFPFSVLLSSSI